MASTTSSSALTRGRSVRLRADTARHAQQPAPQTARTLVIPTSGPLAPTASGLAAGTGTVTSPTRSGSSTHLSSLELFLANLRLLDLDLLPDWPGISAQTFSGAASQGQKTRVQAVEWALYHLFAIWDPQETRSKLSQFFPPADQVQSLNLRAALLKLLDQAKKAGSLGRDTVIRKTMLDDCRGERLEEVLAAFSFAVLRKTVSDRLDTSGAHQAAAQRLALENKGYAGERTELVVLKMAYATSLRRGLGEKDAGRKLFADFEELLGVKERGLARRREQVRGLEAQKCACEVKEAEISEVYRLVRNNWAGNERWMETLLCGDADTPDGLLGMPLERVWRRVKAGRLSEVEDAETGLVEQLDGRVRFQRERLRKWQGLRKDMFGEGPASDMSDKHAPSEAKTGLGLQFESHKSLRLERTSPGKKKDGKVAPQATLTPEYAGLISSLEAELRATSQLKKPCLSTLIPKPKSMLMPMERYSVHSEPEAISEPEDREEEAPAPTEPVPAITKLPQRRTMVRPRPSRKTTDEELPRAGSADGIEAMQRPKLGRKATDNQLRPHEAAQEEPRPPPRRLRDPRASRDPVLPTRPIRQHRVSPPPPTHEPQAQPLRNRSRSRSPVTERAEITEPEQEPSPPDEPESPTQQEADAILASMNAASPSPIKQSFKPRPTLSLAERTLLSMRPSGSTPDEDDITLPLHRPKFKLTTTTPLEDSSPNHDPDDDLIARTRKSMAGFEAARQKAQLERRRSQRKSRAGPASHSRKDGGASHFPGVSEEGDTSVLAEELMGGEQNYEDVFMSRPKIKASPVGSPTKEWEEDGEVY